MQGKQALDLNAESDLKMACEAALVRIYGPHPPEDAVARLADELALFNVRGYAANLLSLRSLVSTLKNGGAFVGPGRGATAGSLVCYLLGITAVDPLDHDLLVERFITPPGKVPSVGIDVDHQRLAVLAAAAGLEQISEHQFRAAAGSWSVDLLGLQTLSRIAGAVRHLWGSVDVSPIVGGIALDDTVTLDALESGTLGDVFQFGSPGARRALRELRPTSFNDLVAVVALYRPGLFPILREYVRQSRAPRPMTEDPVVGQIVDSTHGLFIYQEQIMLAAMRLAGFPGERADLFRWAIGKRIELDSWRNEFFTGATAMGYGVPEIAHLWDQIERRGNLAFCRSHAVSYALLAYWDAYMAANHPQEHAAAALETR